MKIELHDVGAIKDGEIIINEKEINIKYGINGIGKSTISRGIINTVKGDSLNELRTFGSETKPIVKIKCTL